MFSVPSRMYPFILLIILQVVIPNISFLGHGAGIIVGLLVVHGGLNFLLPSTDFLAYLESTPMFAPLSKASGYIRVNNRSMVHSGTSAGNGCMGILRSVWDGLGYVWNVVAALLFIVGCPVERINACFTSVADRIRTTFSSSATGSAVAATTAPLDNSVELGRYARVDTGGDVESPKVPPTTTI